MLLNQSGAMEDLNTAVFNRFNFNIVNFKYLRYLNFLSAVMPVSCNLHFLMSAINSSNFIFLHSVC